MARYQSLPDRTDTFNVTVSDQHMCQNYGLVIDCCTVPANTKCQLNITTACGCCLWCVPAGVQSIFVEIWGAGAGGSGHGGCCCCSAGIGGGAGGYSSATIPTCPGQAFTVCAGTGGAFGCAATAGSNGNTSYISGNNAGNMCARGGQHNNADCNYPCACYGYNTGNTGSGFAPSVFANNALMATGEGGHLFGQASACRFLNRSGSAPFNGGTGVLFGYTVDGRCNTQGASGGNFPGGGGAGGHMSCCCGTCNCGGCGGTGLVRIWY